MYTLFQWILVALAAGGLVEGIDVTWTDAESIKSAASTIAYDMMTYYYGNQTGNNPGNLPPPYYWWEAGAMFMHMVDYYYYTGDPSYNPTVIQAIDWQAGTTGIFEPQNQTRDEGNDDQVFWTFSAMDAAELKFPPPAKGYPSWASMAQGVFNLQSTRWDPENCGGGLRWQITALNPGYTYKNIAANGGLFQLSARLARYTGNQTYVDWAEKMWDWISSSSLYAPQPGGAIRIYDGAEIYEDCKNPNEDQYSYNYGILIGGLAYMYNHTQDDKWLEPLNGVVKGLLNIFFYDHDIIVEVGCEPYNNCNTDGLTFKSFTLRWLAVATQLVPSLGETVWPYLKASAQGAAGQCDGGTDGSVCGYHWTTATYDGTSGVGQQMSALAAVNTQLITLHGLFAPLTLADGATSRQNPNAGTGVTVGDTLAPITTADRAGAWILTILWLAMFFGGTYWLVAVEVL